MQQNFAFRPKKKTRQKRVRKGRLYFLFPNGDCLEKVAVHNDIEGTALKLGEAFGNGKTEAASLCVTGLVAADKSFHKFGFFL